MNDPEPNATADARPNLNEMRRQVGNSYALIRSIIRRSAESATTVDSYAWHLEGRLDVIGRIILTVMRDPAAAFDLAHLVEDELNNQRASGGRNAWSLNGPPVRLDAAAAQVMGLLFMSSSPTRSNMVRWASMKAASCGLPGKSSRRVRTGNPCCILSGLNRGLRQACNARASEAWS